ncbi:hypothetical protein P8452_25112 [Trifolium repens]|nr:hypothetical protein P8452_25112 [Trifolium repens]
MDYITKLILPAQSRIPIAHPPNPEPPEEPAFQPSVCAAVHLSSDHHFGMLAVDVIWPRQKALRRSLANDPQIPEPEWIISTMLEEAVQYVKF